MYERIVLRQFVRHFDLMGEGEMTRTTKCTNLAPSMQILQFISQSQT